MGERNEREDRFVHELFASLRTHVIDVTDDLVERVHDDLEKLTVGDAPERGAAVLQPAT